MSQFTLEGYQIFEKNSSYETGVVTYINLNTATNIRYIAKIVKYFVI